MSALKGIEIPRPRGTRSASLLRIALGERAIVADGAMGTMIQGANPTLEDFEGHEGCNEVLNRTRPDLIESIHRSYFQAGIDAVETNTFGANLSNLGEYGIADQIYELAKAGAVVAKKIADEFTTPESPKWVIGSIGPGTKLPSLGHISYEELKDSYYLCAKGLIDGGADALLVETTQDLLGAKAALNGCRKAMEEVERDLLLIAQITVEATGTMLLGSETLAALASLSALEIDLIGLNCATGPAEMSEHLRQLSQNSKIPISCMPNAGLPVLTPTGARYELSPQSLAEALKEFAANYGVRLLGGCCGTTPEHLRAVAIAIKELPESELQVDFEDGASSLYQFVNFRQEKTYLAVGERSNANGSRAFRDALLDEDWQRCIDIAKDQVAEGAHMIDLSVDYVGRNGVADMSELASRFATAITLPIVLDSTEPNVLKAGLEHLGGRSVINSVNYEDGDGPKSRFAQIMPLVKEHGAAVIALTIDEEGQARSTEWKVRVARRLVHDLKTKWGLAESEIILDCLTFPIATGQEETRKDGIATIAAISQLSKEFPKAQFILGISNVSFGLNPAARIVLNSVFLSEAVKNGLSAAIVHPSKILPLNKIGERELEVALDLIYDRRRFEKDECTYDPLNEFLALFEGVEVSATKSNKLADLMAKPLRERLVARIIDGERSGLLEDLDLAMAEGLEPIEIINTYLLDGMKTVGELFGKGQMQLPFVLQSAEVMKKSVAHLEQFMTKSEAADRGKVLLATVKGDVHDIGKNLVDIIFSNNGYSVVNIGIKQTINQIIDAALENEVDVIGMSGLLVKSTVIMRENLIELGARGLAEKWPILLGGAALTRTFVEDDLASEFEGIVRYSKDAFEGLDLVNTLMAKKRGDSTAVLPPLKKRRTVKREVSDSQVSQERSGVARDLPLLQPPFWGSKIVKGIAFSDYGAFLDERALFMGQWGLDGSAGRFEEMVESEGRPRLRSLLNEISTQNWVEPAVVYGYFPCYSEGNDLVVVHHEGSDFGQERARFTFPRQRRDRRLCISDFFRERSELEPFGKEVFDVVAFHVVTMGNAASRATNALFSSDRYREYLELHGLTVQLTEALAEYWHMRIRNELTIGDRDSAEISSLIDQGYQGSRYSFGYPACPDLGQQTLIMDLLEPGRIGVELSEEFQLHPEQSTSAIIVTHPEARYFNAN